MRLEGLGGIARMGREGCPADAGVRKDGSVADLDVRALPDEDASLVRPAGGVGRIERDRAMLDGGHGPAAQLAMSILVRMADVYGASALMDVSQAHIDSTIYLGEATL